MVFSLCNDGASVKEVGTVTAKKKLKKNIPHHHSCGVWVMISVYRFRDLWLELFLVL